MMFEKQDLKIITINHNRIFLVSTEKNNLYHTVGPL